MKGVVFTTLNDLVEDRFGLSTWDELLERSGSPGIYTTAGTYPDQELFTLVGGLSELLQVDADKLVRTFGEFMFNKLASHYPHGLGDSLRTRDLLLRVHSLIHVEVKKLYPDAELPTFEYETPGPSELVMIYRSHRKLCSLAEGLIEGAARHYGEHVTVHQARCMHHGDDHCRLEMSFEAEPAVL